jgi:hypothetical protein
MVFLYILQLEQGKYYVGKTNHPNFRIEQHFGNSGSAWTRKYTPLSVLKIIPNCDDYDEDKQTIQCMEKYGLENVRGGSFCEITLSDMNRQTLNQMMKGAADKCYTCGNKGHFAKDCKVFVTESKEKEKEPNEMANQTRNRNEMCDCPTSYFSSHRKRKCALNKILEYLDKSDENKNEKEIDDKCLNPVICFRCGRQGHYSTTCYASKHMKGHLL